jgi:uncharacterized membrane protein
VGNFELDLDANNYTLRLLIPANVADAIEVMVSRMIPANLITIIVAKNKVVYTVTDSHYGLLTTTRITEYHISNTLPVTSKVTDYNSGAIIN